MVGAGVGRLCSDRSVAQRLAPPCCHILLRSGFFGSAVGLNVGFPRTKAVANYSILEL